MTGVVLRSGLVVMQQSPVAASVDRDGNLLLWDSPEAAKPRCVVAAGEWLLTFDESVDPESLILRAAKEER